LCTAAERRIDACPRKARRQRSELVGACWRSAAECSGCALEAVRAGGRAESRCALVQLTITTTGLVGMIIFNLIKGRTLCEFIAKPDSAENVRRMHLCLRHAVC
jgi:hypothetical protein